MYNISVCDDESNMRDRIEALVREYFDRRKLQYTLSSYSCGEELLRSKRKTDIAFLDVEMKKLNGIQTGYSLINSNPDLIVFIVTGHGEYLDEAMDLKVFRFLEKPVDKQRLFSALDIITEQSSELTFMSDHVPVTLRERDIACIYIYDRKTYVLTDTGVRYPTILSMKEWVKRTQNLWGYSQPHYSYIINMRYVTRIENKDILIRLKNGTLMKIEASQRKISKFKNEFTAAMRDKL